MSDHPIFAGARAMLKTSADLLDRLEAQIEQVRLVADRADGERAARAAELAEHEHTLANATAKHQQDCATRDRISAARESAVAERERAVAADRERVESAQRWLDHQKADLRNRYSGAA